jgi:putative membrane fusion protein
LTGNEQLAEINNQIVQKTLEATQIINGSAEGNILQCERELNDLLKQKQNFLRDTVTPDATLNEFYANEQTLQERVDNEWSDTIVAPEAGVVSFYFDGAEELLNAENITTVTTDELDEILNGGAGDAAEGQDDETAEKPLFRLVNNYQWFLVAVSDTEIPELAQGNVFSIAFDDYLDKQYEGTVVGTVTEEEGGYIYALEITDDIGQLLNTRRTDAKIFTSFQGMKVPEEAIQEKDGVMGVTVVAGNERTFVPVRVKIMKEGSAIIEPIDEDSILTVNQHVEV